jgi:signal transduction histidine kinase
MGISLLIFLWQMRFEWVYPESPADQFQNDLNEGLTREYDLLQQIGIHWLQTNSTESFSADKFPVEYRLYRNDSLIYYSQGGAFPPVQKIRTWRKDPAPYLYIDRQASYAAVCVGNDSATFLALLPLKIQFPIRNRYLKPLVFSGNPDKWPAAEMNLNPSRLEIRTRAESEVIDRLSYTFLNTTEACLPFRGRALPWLFAFLFFSLVWGTQALYHKIRSRLRVAVILALVLLSFRMLLLYSGFPENWVPTLLFSPRLLAINAWTPSPADLVINLIGLVILVLLALKSVSTLWFRKFPVLYPLFLTLAGCGSGLMLFQVLSLMADNSQTLLNLEKFYAFQAGEWLFFTAAALALSVTWFFFFYAGHWYRQIRDTKRLQAMTYLGAAGIVALGFFTGIPGKPLLWMTWCGLALLAFLQGNRYRLPWKFRLSFMDAVFTLLAMAWVMESTLAVLYREKQDLKLIRLSARFSESRDPLAEYLFNVTVSRIQSDEALVRKPGRMGEGSRSLASILLEDYFLPEYKSYAPRLFLYNQYGLRMDASLDYQPLMNPWRPDPGLLVDGKPGKSLYLVPYNESEIIDKVYVGRFEFFLPVYGKILGIIELFPKSVSGTQIYPRLLLDENVPLQSLPEGYDFAVYLNEKLIRQVGQYDFPTVCPEPEQFLIPKISDGHIRLVRSPAPGKKLILQAYSRTWVDRLVSTSVLFFFFGVLIVVFKSPDFLRQIPLLKGQLSNLLFVQKIRLLLIGFSLIPFLGILFVFRPYIQKSFESDTRENIQKEIARISESITAESRVWLREPGDRSTEELRNILVKAREFYGVDMNLFNANGELLATTQPRVFELGLASVRMPFPAYTDVTHQHFAQTIKSEKIGDLIYWSAYHQISGSDQMPVAWLNIPYLAQQEVLDNRIRNFVSTLIQLYLLVLLVLGILSLTFSRLLTRPLILLRKRMESIRIGGTYEPIAYSSGDEIGDIIRSYNQMLVRLRESEASLAKTQRESAWKEMARQVAHEIKNPLTPMKLSIQHLVRAWKQKDEALDALFDRVTQAQLQQIDSLSEIATAFSSFASMPKPNLETLDVREVIQATVALYEQAEEAMVTYEGYDKPLWVKADRDQFARALQNLVKNALQAIPEGGGTVQLRTEPFSDKVKILVIDSGTGIPEEIKDRVFQPNFSTKNSGMGLGLAMVKRTVESFGGSIRFETQQGKGTTFILELPFTLEVH